MSPLAKSESRIGADNPIKLWELYLFFDDSEELDDSIAPCMPMALISCNIMSRTLVDKASTSAAVRPSVGIGSNTIMYHELDTLQAYQKRRRRGGIPRISIVPLSKLIACRCRTCE